MDKQQITQLLTDNYDAFIGYMNGMPEEEFMFSYKDKWTAGQQLDHIVLCVQPLVRVFSMDKAAIEQTFGVARHASRTYDTLLQDYLEKLRNGGRSPERYLPQPVAASQKAALCDTLARDIKELCDKLDSFTEEELDTLTIPHPLLGNLTMREMLYNVIYHVTHHRQQAEESLNHLGGDPPHL